MMHLPEYVERCRAALEEAGFACYAVGGCVRDALLGLTPQDYDLCTSALPDQIRQVFASENLVLAGLKHGTVGVITPEGVVEITTWRTEGGYRDHRHPDWVQFVPELRSDLARRDFTVNAMAWSPSRGLQDPFGGRQDLENRVLRAVGVPEARFREDALRILRGVRFSARYDLIPEQTTLEAMYRLAPVIHSLAAERVFDELSKWLLLADTESLVRFCPILTQAIPELAPAVDFQQHSPHHAYDVFTHTAYVTGAVPKTPALRWAALLHDIGKPASFTRDETGRGHFKGHAGIGAEMANAVLHRLKAPTALREQVVLLIRQHMLPLEPDRKLLRRWLSRFGEETLLQIVTLQEADFGSKGVEEGEASHFSHIRRLMEEILAENTCLTLQDLAVNGRDLMELGITGRAIGETLHSLLAQVIDEQLPNDRAALLAAIKK
jgi:tRNA nucleotidyltransferase (CCA-adding enzyme)